MRRLARTLAVALPLFASLAACGGDSSPSVDAAPGRLDAAPGGVDASPGGNDAGPSVDANPANLATLSGKITRTAQPMGDARGNIYVALFDRDPVVNMSTAQLVANALVSNADLSAPGASVTYTLAGVTPRTDPYYLVAFLDDNGNVNTANPATAAPDRGDLVSLDGLAAPKVAVPSAGPITKDVVLNSVLPF